MVVQVHITDNERQELVELVDEVTLLYLVAVATEQQTHDDDDDDEPVIVQVMQYEYDEMVDLE